MFYYLEVSNISLPYDSTNGNTFLGLDRVAIYDNSSMYHNAQVWSIYRNTGSTPILYNMERRSESKRGLKL